MMRVVSLKALREFWNQHPEAERPLRRWYKLVTKASWTDIRTLRITFPAADAVTVQSGATMTVFNVGGNKYRVIANIWFPGQEVYIKMVLTHAEYNKNKWKGQL